MKSEISKTMKKGGMVLGALFLLGCSESGAMWCSGPANWNPKRPKKEQYPAYLEELVRCSEADLISNMILEFRWVGEHQVPIKIMVRADKFITTGWILAPGKRLLVACPRARQIRCSAFSMRHGGGEDMIIGEDLLDLHLCGLDQEKVVSISAQYFTWNIIRFQPCIDFSTSFL